jgi:Ca2+/Na+ antiporter
VGDILGANMLDLTYLFAIDLAYGKKLILGDVSRANLVTLVLLVSMYIVIAIAFKFPAQRKMFGFASWYAPLLVAMYILGAYLLFISTRVV